VASRSLGWCARPCAGQAGGAQNQAGGAQIRQVVHRSGRWCADQAGGAQVRQVVRRIRQVVRTPLRRSGSGGGGGGAGGAGC